MFDGGSQKIQALERFLADFWSKLGPRAAPMRPKSGPKAKKVRPNAASKYLQKTTNFGSPKSPPPEFLIPRVLTPSGREVLAHLQGKSDVFPREVVQLRHFRGTPDLWCP